MGVLIQHTVGVLIQHTVGVLIQHTVGILYNILWEFYTTYCGSSIQHTVGVLIQHTVVNQVEQNQFLYFACNNEFSYYFAEKSTIEPYEVSDHDHKEWHLNDLYSAVAGVIILVCVVTIVIITICRIHMRREALQSMMTAQSGNIRRMRRSGHLTHPPWSSWQHTPPRSSWQSTPPTYHSADGEPCIQERYVPPSNVSLNINLHLDTSGVTELSSLMVSPPPYSERDELPREESPPPPYSTLERNVDAHRNTPKTDGYDQVHNQVRSRSDEDHRSRLLPEDAQIVHQADV